MYDMIINFLNQDITSVAKVLFKIIAIIAIVLFFLLSYNYYSIYMKGMVKNASSKDVGEWTFDLLSYIPISFIGSAIAVIAVTFLGVTYLSIAIRIGLIAV